ncbi:hypothetical protein NP233_g10504 [Leucocoprinus birnbaumii]|uniref:Protein kinase domain-containing protein n=1 Tax=Leucocoprinus birnbaumii TaxID=56174 RepID=A0AAD5VK75_9AGAR|nr:hypothetical protein NP233_g10504 [Leucocoprinus birnbaumii]
MSSLRSIQDRILSLLSPGNGKSTRRRKDRGGMREEVWSVEEPGIDPERESHRAALFQNASNFSLLGHIEHSIYQSGRIIPVYGGTGPVAPVLQEKKAIGAELDSLERYPLPRCHPHTRNQLRNQIGDWRRDNARESNVFWLSGPAGAGKSGIAQIVGEECHALKLPFSSFFFSRPDPERDNPATSIHVLVEQVATQVPKYKNMVSRPITPGPESENSCRGLRSNEPFFFPCSNYCDDITTVIPTIILQLIAQIPEYELSITEIFTAEPTILEKDLRTQFKRLLVDPFCELHLKKPFKQSILIILDGLDECYGKEAQCDLINILGEHVRLGNKSPLIWLVCTRTEEHVIRMISDPDLGFQCRAEMLIDDAEAKADVLVVLREELRNVQRRYQLQKTWPGKAVITQIAERSFNFVVVVNAVVCFIGDIHHGDPNGRLEACLRFMENQPMPSKSSIFSSSNSPFERILGNIIPPDLFQAAMKSIGSTIGYLRKTEENSPAIASRAFCEGQNFVIKDFHLCRKRTGPIVQVLEDGESVKSVPEMLEAKGTIAISQPFHRYPSPKCHPYTQKQLRSQIQEWIKNNSRASNMFWLLGLSGVGKSVIARTIAEEYKALTRPFSAFFFSPSNPHDDSVTIVQPSPCSLWSRSLNIEKCKDKQAQRILIKLISDHAHLRSDSPLIWFVCSRPYLHLKQMLSLGAQCRVEEMSIDDAEAKADALTVLRDGLCDIRRQYQLPKSWPGKSVIAQIAERSFNLLVVVSVVVHFIGDIHHGDPSGRLEACLHFMKNQPNLPGSKISGSTDWPHQRIIGNIIPPDQIPIALEIFRCHRNHLDAAHPGTAGVALAKNPSTIFANSRNIVLNELFIRVYHVDPLIRVFGCMTKILQEKRAIGAELDSLERYPPPKCHSKTRKRLRGQIKEWIEDKNRASNIFWLLGSARAGKSAVAQAVSEECKALKRPIASFFFSALDHRNDLVTLIPTLVLQLTIQIPGYLHLVTAIFAVDPNILERDLHTQFKILLLDPFLQLHSEKPFIYSVLIILDGLDICISQLAQCNLMHILNDHANLGATLPLIWLVCSRKTRHLMRMISAGDVQCRQDEISVDDAEAKADSLLVLNDGLRIIQRLYRLSNTWPGDTAITKIAQRSLNYIAIINAIVFFIGDINHGNPDSLLRLCLDFIENNPMPAECSTFDPSNPPYEIILTNMIPKNGDKLTDATVILDHHAPYADTFDRGRNQTPAMSILFYYTSLAIATDLIIQSSKLSVPEEFHLLSSTPHNATPHQNAIPTQEDVSEISSSSGAKTQREPRAFSTCLVLRESVKQQLHKPSGRDTKFAKNLFASFFFSDLDWRHNDPTAVISSLVLQLIAQVPEYKCRIIEILTADPGILERELGIQFTGLLVYPMIQLHAKQPFQQSVLIILDGLDKCSKNTQVTLINLIANQAQVPTSSPLIWLVCSRREEHLARIISSDDSVIEISSVADRETEADVRLVLRDGLHDIQRQYQLPMTWPGDAAITKLAERSYDLFLIVSAIICYIGDIIRGEPSDRLQACLRLMEDQPMLSITDIDGTSDPPYERILASIIPDGKGTAGYAMDLLPGRCFHYIASYNDQRHVLEVGHKSRDFSLDQVTLAFDPLHGNPQMVNCRISVTEILQTKAITPRESGSRQCARPLGCYPCTREGLRGRIQQWCEDAASGYNLFWLIGPAGIGKSAVVESVSEDRIARKQPVASFFFSQENCHDNPTTVVPTLVLQLITQFPHFQQPITQVFATHPDILEQDLHTQFKILLDDPIRELHSEKPFEQPILIILDGLDECNGKTAQCDLISLISNHAHLQTGSPLIWLVSSRPEWHFKQFFHDANFLAHCYLQELLVDDDESRADLLLLLREAFQQIRRESGDHLPDRWPGEAVITAIAEGSLYLFAVVKNVIHFIRDWEQGNPNDRLQASLQLMERQPILGIPNFFNTLDQLYLRVLANIPTTELPVTMRILCLHVLYTGGNLCVSLHASLLGLDPSTFYSALKEMHSVLLIPPLEHADQSGIQFYHASFSQFIQDGGRNRDFIVAWNTARGDVFIASLRWLNKLLHFTGHNKCRVPLPAIPTDWVPGHEKHTFLSKVFAVVVKLSWDSCLLDLPTDTVSTILEALGGFDFCHLTSSKWISQHLLSLLNWLHAVDEGGVILKRSTTSFSMFGLKLSSPLQVAFPLDPQLCRLDFSSTHIINPPSNRKQSSAISVGAAKRACIIHITHDHSAKVVYLMTSSPLPSGIYRTLLEKQGQEAQRIIDIFQEALTSPIVDYYDVSRPVILGILLHLVKKTKLYPQRLVLAGVTREEIPIAEGAYGAVWKGVYQQHDVCVKMLKINLKSQHTISTAREAILWSQLNHSNVLPFYGIFSDAGRIGLSQDNILIKPDGSACLADFGLSAIAEGGTLSTHVSRKAGGTLCWMAPEIALDRITRQTLKSDVYSLSSVMLEVREFITGTFTGKNPYPRGTKDYTIIRYLMEGKRPGKPDKRAAPELTNPIWEIMQKAWSEDPIDRPTIQELMEKLAECAPRPNTSTHPISEWDIPDTRNNAVSELDVNFLESMLNIQEVPSPSG